MYAIRSYYDRYAPHKYTITCVDTVKKSYKTKDYNINGNFPRLTPFDNTNFIIA